MSNETTNDSEETETEAKPTITVAEKNSGGTSTAKETITVAEKSERPS